MNKISISNGPSQVFKKSLYKRASNYENFNDISMWLRDLSPQRGRLPNIGEYCEV